MMIDVKRLYFACLGLLFVLVPSRCALEAAAAAQKSPATTEKKPGSAQRPETFGCEANPTGNPIGGGEGYRDIKDSGDFTVRNAEELYAALEQAQPGQVVFIPDATEIDLTDKKTVKLGPGVTLAGTRGAGQSLGARLFTNNVPSPLIETAGPRARVTGLRIEGGNTDPRDRLNAVGIQTTHYGLEIDNCEVFHFGYVGVNCIRGSTQTYVHHCFLHHIQSLVNGYPIVVYEADARIIANKFGFSTRHRVSATGHPGTSYEAAWNLVLREGNGQCFDMHSGLDRGDGTNYAGDWIKIHHNTFQNPDWEAIAIKGVPSQGAEIHHNWFAEPVRDAFKKEGVFNSLYLIGFAWPHEKIRVYRNVRGPQKYPFNR
jgi:hypothetical protein